MQTILSYGMGVESSAINVMPCIGVLIPCWCCDYDEILERTRAAVGLFQPPHKD